MTALELTKPCENTQWNMHFQRKSFQQEKRRSAYSQGFFSGTPRKHVFHLYPDHNLFVESLGNGMCPCHPLKVTQALCHAPFT